MPAAACPRALASLQPAHGKTPPQNVTEEATFFLFGSPCSTSCDSVSDPRYFANGRQLFNRIERRYACPFLINN